MKKIDLNLEELEDFDEEYKKQLTRYIFSIEGDKDSVVKTQ
jgi:hypothetical protein